LKLGSGLNHRANAVLWSLPDHIGHAVLGFRSEAEDEGVPGPGVGFLLKDLIGRSVADLKQARLVRMATQIDAQRDQPIVNEVIVPIVVVPRDSVNR
jgi:hypothetical protein